MRSLTILPVCFSVELIWCCNAKNCELHVMLCLLQSLASLHDKKRRRPGDPELEVGLTLRCLVRGKLLSHGRVESGLGLHKRYIPHYPLHTWRATTQSRTWFHIHP